MKGTFNAFGQTAKSYENCNTPVWLGTVTPIPVGGMLATGYAVKGAYYGAGFPIRIEDKTITPVLQYSVVSVDSGVVTLSPIGHNFCPTTSMKLVKVVSTSAYPTTAGTAITAVTANADGTFAATSSVSVSAGDYVAVAGTVPNAYLYNDIYMDDIDTEAGASGSAVKFHGEGILIDRTACCGIAGCMATLVPGVLQVNG